MSSVTLPRIKSVEPRSNFKLAVSWDKGPRSVIDFSQDIENGIFSALKDPKLFERVRIGERSRTVEWPEPKDDLGYPIIEIDAESLAAMALDQRNIELVERAKAVLKAFASIVRPKGSDKPA